MSKTRITKICYQIVAGCPQKVDIFNLINLFVLIEFSLRALSSFFKLSAPFEFSKVDMRTEPFNLWTPILHLNSWKCMNSKQERIHEKREFVVHHEFIEQHKVMIKQHKFMERYEWESNKKVPFSLKNSRSLVFESKNLCQGCQKNLFSNFKMLAYSGPLSELSPCDLHFQIRSETRPIFV